MRIILLVGEDHRKVQDYIRTQKLECIEYPEWRKSPQQQVDLARDFVKTSNFRCITFATQSDYIIRELNNMIMLYKERNNSTLLLFEDTKLINKHGYNKYHALNPKDIQVFLIGDEVTELEVTETGLEVDYINKVISEMNYRCDDIYFTLFE